MNRVIQRRPKIDLSKLADGKLYEFTLRSGEKTISAVEARNASGSPYPYRLTKSLSLYRTNGSYHWDDMVSRFDIVKIRSIEQPQ